MRVPPPPAGRSLGGAATGSWGPHKPGLGEPVTISGRLGSNTLTVKPRAPNLTFEACPFLPQGYGGRTSPTPQSS